MHDWCKMFPVLYPLGFSDEDNDGKDLMMAEEGGGGRKQGGGERVEVGWWCGGGLREKREVFGVGGGIREVEFQFFLLLLRLQGIIYPRSFPREGET